MSILELAALPSRVMRDVRALQSALADVLREYVRESSPAGGTPLLRRAAEIQVEIRQYFERNGEPDWLGKSYAYRQLMTETYGMAGVMPSERKKVGDAVRYHILNVLRERLSPEELSALELREADGPARAKELRDRTRALVGASESRLAGAHEGPLTTLAFAIEAIAAIRAEHVKPLSEDDRKEMLRNASTLRRESDRIARMASKPPKKK